MQVPMPRHGRCPTVAVLVLVLCSSAAECFSGRTLRVSFASQRGALPRMDAASDVTQLEAELKILQLKKQIAEMQAQQAAPAASPAPAPTEVLVSPPPPPLLPAPAEVLASPPPLPAVPAPAEVVVSEPTLPVPAPVASQPPAPEGEICLTLSGDPRPCTDLVDLNELVGGIKPAFSLDALPSPEKLLQLDTALPLIVGLVTLAFGYSQVSKFAESLRPDDAATAKRKREERERLGISEEDEERESQAAREQWIQGAVAAFLILGFELALFSLRNV